jgi:hypothetical protein
MKLSTPQRTSLLRIIRKTYTSEDVRECVQLCSILALPLIRKKIVSGKLNLDIIGLKERDVVIDCLADLFRRDGAGAFVSVTTFFEGYSMTSATLTDDELLIGLRKLVFMKVHSGILRLYNEVDPVLGKILRNLEIAVHKSDLFEETHRFGEACLHPRNMDTLPGHAPMTAEFLRQQFFQIVLLHDSLPVMLKKVHWIMCEQDHYQRCISLVQVALMFKEVYTLGWGPAEEAEVSEAGQVVQSMDVQQLADQVCHELAGRKDRRNAAGGEETGLRSTYLSAVRGILLDEFAFEGGAGRNYFEHLKEYIPGLTKTVYKAQHRTTLEYLAKIAKARMRSILKHA